MCFSSFNEHWCIWDTWTLVFRIILYCLYVQCLHYEYNSFLWARKYPSTSNWRTLNRSVICYIAVFLEIMQTLQTITWNCKDASGLLCQSYAKHLHLQPTDITHEMNQCRNHKHNPILVCKFGMWNTCSNLNSNVFHCEEDTKEMFTL